MNALTRSAAKGYAFAAAPDASGAGRENPFQKARQRQSCRLGRFFCARNLSMAGWRGTRKRGRLPFGRFLTPVQSVAPLP